MKFSTLTAGSGVLLPERLLDLEVTGGRIVPRYLTTRDYGWVAHLLETVEACEGQPRAEVERRLAQPPRQGERWLAWKALVTLVLRWRGFTVLACGKPILLREALFQGAVRLAGQPRGAILQDAAGAMGVTAEALERDLYADLPAEKILGPTKEEVSASELITRYNLALAQGVLLRAEELQVSAAASYKAILRFARLQRLLCRLEANPQTGELRVHLSGPLSIFHHTTKYGRAMAAWLPAVVRSPRWKIWATCILDGQRLTWTASHLDSLGTTHQPVRPFDSKLEQRFFRDLRRAAPEWEVLRESDPVQVGRQILCPDFTLVHPVRGLRIPVEIVGYWTPEYLAHKFKTLRALPKEMKWLVCIDESLTAAKGQVQPPPGPMFRFKRRINIDEFMVFLEGEIGRRRGKSNC